MDFTELTNSLKEKVANKDKLEQEKKQLEQSFADTLRHNYNTIFAPEYAKIVEMDELLRKTTGKDFTTEVGDGSGLYYSPACYSSCGLYYKNRRVRLYDTSNCNSDIIRDFSKVFLNADTTLAFLDKVKSEVFVNRFGIYGNYLDAQSDSFRKDIALLLDKMSHASSVKENTDGTIEITLNGKTYVGAVKEK